MRDYLLLHGRVKALTMTEAPEIHQERVQDVVVTLCQILSQIPRHLQDVATNRFSSV